MNAAHGQWINTVRGIISVFENVILYYFIKPHSKYFGVYRKKWIFGDDVSLLWLQFNISSYLYMPGFLYIWNEAGINFRIAFPPAAVLYRVAKNFSYLYFCHIRIRENSLQNVLIILSTKFWKANINIVSHITGNCNIKWNNKTNYSAEVSVS